jgi:hypothetical protein
VHTRSAHVTQAKAQVQAEAVPSSGLSMARVEWRHKTKDCAGPKIRRRDSEAVLLGDSQGRHQRLRWIMRRSPPIRTQRGLQAFVPSQGPEARAKCHLRRGSCPPSDLPAIHLAGPVWVDAPPPGDRSKGASIPRGAAHTHRPHCDRESPRPGDAVCRPAHISVPAGRWPTPQWGGRHNPQAAVQSHHPALQPK